MLDKKYNEIISLLKEKYGDVPGDYFANETCRSQNTKIKRGSEGLFIHHIDEDKIYDLSTPKEAIKHDYAFQKADRLVYCDYLEHLILHIKIVEETDQELVGALLFMIPEINNIFSGWKSEISWRLAVYNSIIDKKNEYLKIFEYCIKVEKIDIQCFFQSGVFRAQGWENEFNYALYFEFAEIAKQYYDYISIDEMIKSLEEDVLSIKDKLNPMPENNIGVILSLSRHYLLPALFNELNKKELIEMIKKIIRKVVSKK
ncbi:MAG: hypothetical protein ACRDCJ_02120 [Metamycoplasmataceae bacterium]